MIEKRRSKIQGWGVFATPDDMKAFGRSVGNWPAFPDSALALAYLKQHFKLVVLSNIDRESFSYSNAKLGIESRSQLIRRTAAGDGLVGFAPKLKE